MLYFNEKSYIGPQWGIYVGEDGVFYMFCCSNLQTKIKLSDAQGFLLSKRVIIELGIEQRGTQCEYIVKEIRYSQLKNDLSYTF